MTDTSRYGVNVGATGEQTLIVVEEFTVGFTLAGMPMVLATPEMIYHMEIVAAESIKPFLPEGYLSVGTHVDVRHLAASSVGTQLITRSEVIKVEGVMITFSVQTLDAGRQVGAGTHTRAVVEVERFNRGLAS